MTLLQLIAHLKKVYEEHGNCEVLRVAVCEEGTYEVDMDESDIWVSTDSQTITFT